MQFIFPPGQFWIKKWKYDRPSKWKEKDGKFRKCPRVVYHVWLLGTNDQCIEYLKSINNAKEDIWKIRRVNLFLFLDLILFGWPCFMSLLYVHAIYNALFDSSKSAEYILSTYALIRIWTHHLISQFLTNLLVAQSSISHVEHWYETLTFHSYVLYEERNLVNVLTGFDHKNQRVLIN